MESNSKCKLHPDQELSLYCEEKECECFICSMCIISHHKHSLRHISTLIPLFKESLDSAIKNTEENTKMMNDILKDISHKFKELNNTEYLYEKEQTEFIDSLIYKIRQEDSERKVQKSKILATLSELANNANLEICISRNNLIQWQDMKKELVSKPEINSLTKIKDKLNAKDNLISKVKLINDKFKEIEKFVENSKIACLFKSEMINSFFTDKRISELLSQINEQRTKQFNAEIAEAKKEINKMYDIVNKLIAENTELAPKLSESNQEIINLKESIAFLEKDNAQKSSECETLLKQLQAFENQRIKGGEDQLSIYSNQGFLQTGYITSLSVKQMMLNGFKNLVAVSMITPFEFKEAMALKAAAAEAPKDTKKEMAEKPKAEEKKEEEVVGGLGGMFGDDM